MDEFKHVEAHTIKGTDRWTDCEHCPQWAGKTRATWYVVIEGILTPLCSACKKRWEEA